MLYRIKLGSITNAQRAAKILKAKGYRVTIGRMQNPKKEEGCGYLVKLKADDIGKTLDILKNKGINYIGVDEG